MRRTADPISGTWAADGTGLLFLTFDGGRRVSGTVTSGRPGSLATISHGDYQAATGVLRLEGRAAHPKSGAPTPFLIEGRLEKRRLTVHYSFGETSGRLSLKKVTWWYSVCGLMRRASRQAPTLVEPIRIPIARFLLALGRPSKAANLRILRERGEDLASLTFRDAVAADIPTLAALHVKTWSATYPGVRHPPTFEIRERQWREAFASDDGSWFCVVIENARGELIGFAKGVRQPNGRGDLNKIYLLTEYQRMGLGRRLVAIAAERFLRQGLSEMTLIADPANPSCGFYERLGAECQRDEKGRVCRGAYVWRDLQKLLPYGT
jgi:ribosomal protein S18 acetylase RimI-like enzyme